MSKEILDTLRFVRGAVSTKNLLPELKHYIIQGGTVCGFNGMIALSSPIDFDIDCAPLAVPLFQAIGNCGDVTGLGITGTGRLSVKSGKFKAFIDCVDIKDIPSQSPEGEMIEFDGKQMLEAITKLVPFVGNDASRPWTNGILLRGQSAFATNNVCLVEYWIGTTLPFTLNIPMAAIKELARIGSPPTHAQLSEGSITFHYTDGSWLKTSLYETNWPDLSKILNVPASPVAVPAELFAAIEHIKPFVEKDNRIYFRHGAVCTSTREDIGASYEVEGLVDGGIYNINMLNLLNGVAEKCDFTLYPAPLLFYGSRLRGAIVGQRA
jgi:DNA polymerase III sliding clamp (beta) subunit (PCNA family)